MTDNKYSFHASLKQEGKQIELYLSRLTKRQAETLHKMLEQNYSHVHSSAELNRYGWEEHK